MGETSDDVGAVTEDRLLGGRVLLRQPAAGYRVAIDPVILAAAVREKPQARVLDLGCGVGAAALCLLARCPELIVCGLELQPYLAHLARINGGLNAQHELFCVTCGDLRSPPFGPASFDHVMLNPAFHPPGARPSQDPSRALAMHEGETDLSQWLSAALTLLRPGGQVSLILRADRLDEALAALHGRAAALEITPLWPKAGEAAKRVVMTARKGAKGAAQLNAGLVLHAADGRYSDAARAILEEAQALNG